MIKQRPFKRCAPNDSNRSRDRSPAAMKCPPIASLKRGLILILTPLVLLPLPAVVQTKEAYAGYILLLMAVFWITEVIPLAVTALIPIVLAPMFRLVPSNELCNQYITHTNALFMGGLIIATAVERWQLHKRIALGVMLLLGTSHRRLMLGFMLPSWFLSMWISNTATTAMMIPIVEAVLSQMKNPTPQKKSEDIELSRTDSDSNQINQVSPQQSGGASKVDDERHSNLAKAMCLSIAYAASCGGIGTLTGTGPNLVLSNQVTQCPLKSKTNFSFGSWMIYAVPMSFVSLMGVWLWLQLWFIGPRKLFNCKSDKEQEKATRRIIRKNYNQLGPVTFAEGSCIGFFCLIVFLWISRDPGVPGWAIWFNYDGTKYVRDVQPAMLVAILLFMWPARNPFRRKQRTFHLQTAEKSQKDKESSTLLTWADMVNFPWSIVLLLGGGFALAKTCESSGLSRWVGAQLAFLKSLPTAALVILVTGGSAFFTEFTSNTATATILMPILKNLAISIGIHPFLLMLPAAVGCSLAFCLPVATPPNAIVFAKGYLSVLDMMKVGIFLNIMCILIVTGGTLSYGAAFFKMYTIPDWNLPCNNATAGN